MKSCGIDTIEQRNPESNMPDEEQDRHYPTKKNRPVQVGYRFWMMAIDGVPMLDSPR